MGRFKNYFDMALALLMIVVLICAIGTGVTYATKAATRDYQYEALRKDTLDTLEKQNRDQAARINELEKRLEAQIYISRRRYDLILREMEFYHGKVSPETEMFKTITKENTPQ